MAEWAVAIVEGELAKLRINDLCNAWWYMAPRLLSVASSALFLIVLALTWLYNQLFNVAIDSTPSNSTNICAAGSRSSGSTVRLIASCTGALAYAAAATWEKLSHPSDGGLLFFLAQCFTWIAFTAICALEIREARVVALRGLARAWWTIAFLLAATETTALVIQRREKNCCRTVALEAAMVNLVASLVLVATAILECSRKKPNPTHLNGDAEEPLLGKQGTQQYIGYAGASRLSRLTWRWMNPLLQKGYDARLEVADVPTLAPGDDAERLYERYGFHKYLNWLSFQTDFSL